MELRYQIEALSCVLNLLPPLSPPPSSKMGAGGSIAAATVRLGNVHALTNVRALAYLLHFFPLKSLSAEIYERRKRRRRRRRRRRKTNARKLLGGGTGHTEEEEEEEEDDEEDEEEEEEEEASFASLLKVDHNKVELASIQALTLKLVVALGKHSLHPLELKLLLHMIPQPLFNQMLLRITRAQPTANFIEFDTTKKGYACVEVPQVLSRDTGWFQEGFAFSAWINIRHASEDAASPSAIPIFRLETSSQVVILFVIQRGALKVYGEDAKSASTAKGPRRQQLYLVASLNNHRFVQRRWTHIALSYATRFKRGNKLKRTSFKESATPTGKPNFRQ
eukprot:jgi/Bigna1/132467/aug1.17_g7175